MASAIELNRLNALEKGCVVRVTGDESGPAVAGNPTMLIRVIDNLLRNAIEYAPRNSHVDVRIERKQTQAAIGVRDYGPGVPDEMLTDIFKPFFRVDDSRTASTGAVGLGLSIVQRAVALHGGTVSAVNAHPGLDVLVLLPLLHPQAVSTTSATAAASTKVLHDRAGAPSMSTARAAANVTTWQ